MQTEFHVPNYTKKWYNSWSMKRTNGLVSFGDSAKSAMCVVAVLFAAMLSSSAVAADPIEWENVDQAHYLAGRMASAGYFRGKVVCLDCRDYGDKSGVDAMRRLEEVWQTFKMKPFILIGSHRGTADAEKIKRIAGGLKLTYPIYRDADMVRPQGREDADPGRVGYLYIVGSTGKILYCGKDDRHASGVVAGALMAMRSPQTPKQWKHYIDYDIKVLPGRAYLEIEEFRKAFPNEAAEYDDVCERFNADMEIKRLAKLERIAQQAKDYDFKDANAKRLNLEKVEKAIGIYANLTKSENPFVAQEAKNCIADLTWTVAMLKPSAKNSTKQGAKK